MNDVGGLFEELGGTDLGSANLCRTHGEGVLKPCEVSAAKVNTFLGGLSLCGLALPTS